MAAPIINGRLHLADAHHNSPASLQMESVSGGGCLLQCRKTKVEP